MARKMLQATEGRPYVCQSGRALRPSFQAENYGLSLFPGQDHPESRIKVYRLEPAGSVSVDFSLQPVQSFFLICPGCHRTGHASKLS